MNWQDLHGEENVKLQVSLMLNFRTIPHIHCSECCKKIVLSSTGPAAVKQWDRMGIYSYTGQTLHGRYVYQHQNFTQSIFYIFGEFDGWLLGPTPDLNFGGIKNSHDRMCVHTHDNIDSKAWGYYDGPRDTKVQMIVSLTLKCSL